MAGENHWLKIDGSVSQKKSKTMKSKIKFLRRFKLRTATLYTSADSSRRELSAGVLNVTGRARNVGFMMKLLFRFFCILSFGALVAESPQEGAIQLVNQNRASQYKTWFRVEKGART